jgi:hypothetical protein
MAHQEELRMLAEGTPPAPARIVGLDVACEVEALGPPAAELAEAADAGWRVTLRVGGLAARGSPAPERADESAWPSHQGRPAELVAARLRAAAERLGREGRALAPEALALPGAVAHPEELALGALGACRGRPRVHLLLSAEGLEAVQRGRALALEGGDELDARQWWCGLLALAATAGAVSLVPAVPGPGLSPLASAQRWAGPSPHLAELMPPRPSRLRLDVDFGRLLEASGGRPADLARLAGRIVVAADEALGRGAVPGGTRRLALYPAGIARAVLGSGRDPRRYSTLAWLSARLRAFKDGARAASVRLARLHGAGGGLRPFPLPGTLEVAEAGALDRAVLVHGARHSHLVCISPWSLAPPEYGRDCLGLMPALACADSIAWCRPGGECPAGLYGETLRFAWAVAMRS